MSRFILLRQLLLISAMTASHFAVQAAEMPIVVATQASSQEQLAAREVMRYVYLRTGRLLSISAADTLPAGPVIVVSRRDRPIASDATFRLAPQQYALQPIGENRLLLVGGDDTGTLYAAYRLAERLGVRFYLHGDVIPDQRVPLNLSGIEEVGRPLFDTRGIQPFHDFSEGPDWWNRDDWLAYIGQLSKLRMNFLGLHCYPEAGPGPEPLVWIGLPEDLDEQGNPQFSYPTHWENTLRDRTYWGYSAMKTSEFCAGAAQLFPGDVYGPAVMEGMMWRPETADACNELFVRSGAMLRDAFALARQLGIKTCVGTETPLCIPAMVKQRLKNQGLDPDDSATVKRLYAGIFQRIMRVYPVDYYWLWTPEGWTWSGNAPEQYEATVRDMHAALAAVQELKEPLTLATCGWVLGPVNDRAALDRDLPKHVPLSCINRQVGHEPVEPGFADVVDRPKWAIPWMENDPELTSPQPWVGRMRYDAVDARRYGCNGLLGIHWRTKALAMNVAALADAAWDQSWVPAEFDAQRVQPAHRPVGPAGGLLAAFTAPVANSSPEEQAIYQTVRYDMQGYSLEVPDGVYQVVLKLNEPHYGEPGKRVFGVKIQGRQMFSGLDLFAKHGRNKAVDFTCEDVRVVDGRLNVDFIREVEFPCIAGIVIQGKDLLRKINCGGPVVGDWEADDVVKPSPDRMRSMPIEAFYRDFAAAHFGSEVADDAGRIFAAIDGEKYPKCSFWGTGPGDIKIEKLSAGEIGDRYAFVDQLESLRSRVVGSGNLQRFDYWLNTYRYARAAAEAGRLRGALDDTVQAMREQPDEINRKALAEQAVRLRIELARAWERTIGWAIAVVDTPGELGTIDNLERHTRRTDRFVDAHDDALQAVLGQLPSAAQLSDAYSGAARITVLTRRTQVSHGEPLTIRVLVISPESQQPTGSLFWREMGVGDFQQIPLTHVSRGIWEATLPAADSGVQAIEYYVQVACGIEKLVDPPTAPDLASTVVVAP